MDTSKMIKAYCLKTKEKNVPMQDAVVTKTARGGYMAAGHDGKGNKMAAILSEAKALKAIADGVAHRAPLFFICLTRKLTFFRLQVAMHSTQEI
jgi:hypothetical protein